MNKVKLGDMSYEDKEDSQYYKRVLQDFYIYGPVELNLKALRRVAKIENKYAGSESK